MPERADALEVIGLIMFAPLLYSTKSVVKILRLKSFVKAAIVHKITVCRF
jgi:hypothetical protein